MEEPTEAEKTEAENERLRWEFAEKEHEKKYIELCESNSANNSSIVFQNFLSSIDLEELSLLFKFFSSTMKITYLIIDKRLFKH